MQGWRTLVVETGRNLSLENGQILLERADEEESDQYVPIGQLRTLILATPKGSVSLPLLLELTQNNVAVLLCDAKYRPYAQLSPLFGHTDTAGAIMDQARWQAHVKDHVWMHIVTAKLLAQARALMTVGLPVPELLFEYAKSVEAGDTSNREGMAARVYFNTMFTKDFVRHEADDTNAALNYGYAILLSAMNRILTSHGYHTALGIHHLSRQNPFNLSCDLMEPFRPFVDRIVYATMGMSLDWERKKALIATTRQECVYNDKRMDLESAMEAFALDILKTMNDPQDKRLFFPEMV